MNYLSAALNVTPPPTTSVHGIRQVIRYLMHRVAHRVAHRVRTARRVGLRFIQFPPIHLTNFHRNTLGSISKSPFKRSPNYPLQLARPVARGYSETL